MGTGETDANRRLQLNLYDLIGIVSLMLASGAYGLFALSHLGGF